MKIKKATLDNLLEIKELSSKYKFEEDRNFEDLISSKKSEMFIMTSKSKIIGFTGLIYHNWNNTIQISDIFIDPRYRNKGLGLKLVTFLIKKSKKTKYRCLIAEAPSLNPVLHLYKKAGFRICGYNDRYYSNSGKEVAFWMSYDLE
jgi:ribosomal protein S18 acetylase RimI-like enzyme